MHQPVNRTAVKTAFTSAFILFLWISTGHTSDSFGKGLHINESTLLYRDIDFGDHQPPESDIFYYALDGYNRLLESNKLSKKEIITVIDFRKSANEKRLWVIDLGEKKLLYHSLVAHGRNSGELYAEKFSNIPNSYQSSLGFFVTGDTYIGKHGVSLKLKGVENGINDLAEARAIVMHGAEYVSEAFIERAGRLGRSHGCPAVPMEIHKELIPLLAGGACLFIYYPDKEYLSKTKFNSRNENSSIFSANKKIIDKRY